MGIKAKVGETPLSPSKGKSGAQMMIWVCPFLYPQESFCCHCSNVEKATNSGACSMSMAILDCTKKNIISLSLPQKALIFFSNKKSSTQKKSVQFLSPFFPTVLSLSIQKKTGPGPFTHCVARCSVFFDPRLCGSSRRMSHLKAI